MNLRNRLFVFSTPLLLSILSSSGIAVAQQRMLDQLNNFNSVSSSPATRNNGQTWLFAKSSNTQTGIKSDCLLETSRIVGPVEEKLFGPLDNRKRPAPSSTRSLRELVDLCQKEMVLSFDGEIEYRIFILMGVLGEHADKEIFYLRKSAEKGNVKGQSFLGYSHYLGNVVGKNIALAIYYLEESANAGFLFSTIQLSIIYREIELEPGRFNNIKFDKVDSTFMGKEERIPRWIYWLQRASESDTQSAVKLARLYERGENVVKDENIAVRLLSGASEMGDLAAAIALSSVYMKRSSDPKYLKLAIRQIEHAAKLGDPGSQLLAGRAYLRGTGVDVNRVKAEYWLRKSADAGNSRAKKLIELHFEGK